MKRIHPEDPRVTAHALGELPAVEAAELERAAQTNPAIRAALEETHALAGLIRAGFRAEIHELGEARREAIRRAGRRPAPENLVSLQRPPRWVRPVLITSAAAVLVVGAVWMIQQVPVGENSLTEAEQEAAQRAEVRTRMLLGAAPRPNRLGAGGALPAAPAPAPAGSFRTEDGLSAEAVAQEYGALRDLLESDPDRYHERVRNTARTAGLPSLAKLPGLVDNPFVAAREQPASLVPIVAGSASFPLVERFVRTEGKLPPKNAVRVEELINHVAYEDRGDAEIDGIRLGAELVRCPWDPGAILMGVLLHNGSERVIPPSALLGIEVRSAFIRSYRLIGFAAASGTEAPDAPVQQGLAPGQSNFVLYQLQPLQSEVFDEHRVVSLVVLQLDKKHRQVPMVPASSPPRDWANASNNLQTAVTLAAWGMLLRESPYRGTLTPDQLETFATEAREGVAEGNLARREALQLVLDSLPLLRAR